MAALETTMLSFLSGKFYTTDLFFGGVQREELTFEGNNNVRPARPSESRQQQQTIAGDHVSNPSLLWIQLIHSLCVPLSQVHNSNKISLRLQH